MKQTKVMKNNNDSVSIYQTNQVNFLILATGLFMWNRNRTTRVLNKLTQLILKY